MILVNMTKTYFINAQTLHYTKQRIVAETSVNSFNRSTYLTSVTNGLLTALLFSLFIYLEYFNLTVLWLNLFSAFIALYRILNAKRKEIIFTGFFIGILWFYWIVFSFRFYDISYLIPVGIVGFALFYALFFTLISFFINPFYRASILLLLSYIEPFGFNWFKVELLFINTPLPADTITLGITLLILSISIKYSKKSLPLLVALFLLPQHVQAKLPKDLNVKLISTQVSQHHKWQEFHKQEQIKNNLSNIKLAKDEGVDLVVLPESVFPVYLNEELKLINELKGLSYSIAIIAGGLFVENSLIYNATYFFNNGEMQIAKKMVLVPFGEYTPLPKFFRDWINSTFFNGAQDYEKAKQPTDFTIKGYKLRNAICYEATSKEVFINSPGIMIATSNNAWFTPSIEPTLQKLLMRYYARLNSTLIYHSANSDGSSIIR